MTAAVFDDVPDAKLVKTHVGLVISRRRPGRQTVNLKSHFSLGTGRGVGTVRVFGTFDII